jgi:hypothetical protein
VGRLDGISLYNLDLLKINVGIFPVPAVTTVVTLFLLWVLPTNFSPAQKGLAIAFNLLVAPLQFLVMPFFVIVGGMLFNGLQCDPVSLMAKFQSPEVCIDVYRYMFNLNCCRDRSWSRY